MEREEVPRIIWEAQQIAERVTYTAGTNEWYLASSPTGRVAYFKNVCQHELGLHPSTPLFAHCMQREQEFLSQRVQFQTR